jgi:hypothetical protein
MVLHARTDMTFHSDCWVALHAQIQGAYLQRAEVEGVRALIDPYNRTDMASWLPEAAIDEAVEALGEQLDEHLGGSQAQIETLGEAPGEEPMAG